MDVIASPTSSTNIETLGGMTNPGFFSSINTCPKCGRQKGLPVTHNEEPDADELLRIKIGELLWIRLSAPTNPYRLATNWKCICCEFEWRERLAPV